MITLCIITFVIIAWVTVAGQVYKPNVHIIKWRFGLVHCLQTVYSYIM